MKLHYYKFLWFFPRCLKQSIATIHMWPLEHQEELASCEIPPQCGRPRLSQASLAKVVDKASRYLFVTGYCSEKSAFTAYYIHQKMASTKSEKCLTSFSTRAWECMPSEQKAKHTLKQCSECHTRYLSLTLSFPEKRDRLLLRKKNNLTLEFDGDDMSSATNFGKKALKQLNNICEAQFNKPIQS